MSVFFAGRMKRIDAKKYFLYGSDQKGNYGLLQKRDNRNDVIWEKQYQYGSWSCITDVGQYKTSNLLAITGWTENKDDKSVSAWINVIDDDGSVIAREVFDINATDHIRVPQIAVLDNDNIAIVYNKMFKGRLTDVEYRIYSADLKLKFSGSVASDPDFLHYGMAVIDGGFVVVNNMFDPSTQYIMLHQYNFDGKKVRSIKLDDS